MKSLIVSFWAVWFLSQLLKSTFVALKQLWIIHKWVNDALLQYNFTKIRWPVDLRPSLQSLSEFSKQVANLGYFFMEDSELENIKIGEAKGKIFGKYPLGKKITDPHPHPPPKKKKKKERKRKTYLNCLLALLGKWWFADFS